MDADKKADRTTKRTTLRWAESIDKLNGHFKRNEFETRARALPKLPVRWRCQPLIPIETAANTGSSEF